MYVYFNVSRVGVNSNVTIDGRRSTLEKVPQLTRLNNRGNIFVGGYTSVTLGGRYGSGGLDGCIGGLEISDSPILFDSGQQVKSGTNAAPCY